MRGGGGRALFLVMQVLEILAGGRGFRLVSLIRYLSSSTFHLLGFEKNSISIFFNISPHLLALLQHLQFAHHRH